MPSHSRSRERHRDRDREYTRRRHYDDADDVDDYDADHHYRRHRSRHSRGQSRGYEFHGYHEYDVDENEYGEEDDPMVDYYGRTRRSRPRDERTRIDRSKAKESPATSPKKRSDREGHRRRGDSRGADGSPTRGAAMMRERRHRNRDGDDYDRERELRRQQRRRERERERAAEKHASTDSANSASQLLSADALAKLNMQYEREKRREQESADEDLRYEKRRQRRREALNEKAPGYDEDETETPRRSQKRRLVSGAVMEEGEGPRLKVGRRGGGGSVFSWGGGDGDDANATKKKKRLWIGIGVLALVLIIVIPVAVVVSKKKSTAANSDPSSSSSQTNLTASLANVDPNSIPVSTCLQTLWNGIADIFQPSAKGTYFDPFTWLDTRDFNLTYTNETVGGLPIMGLNSTWDDSARPNPHVPPLNQNFSYGTQPIRGVNLGGWLSIEPFITPSFFSRYPLTDGVVDEWTLSQKLGSSAASVIEKHYATFISEEDFAEMQAAGLDHVRIQYSYWAVKTYDGDPYVPQISWRYLLRAIEYCRKYGLRVNLDLHGIPGSQNGWNHSGRQGPIGWLNGTDGELNAQRSLEIHDQLSQFFAQPRYKNIVTIYGLCNEPKMLSLPIESVLNWTTAATELVQRNGITAMIAFGDGFLNLSKWKYMLKNGPPNMLLDTHQYTIFNTAEICLTHQAKINLTCNDWKPMIATVNSPTEG